MTDSRHEQHREDERADAPSEDATSDIEEQQGDDADDGGRAPEDAPAY
jgi:hypothetical protein